MADPKPVAVSQQSDHHPEKQRKSPHHHKETHGISDDIDESTPMNEVKGPNVFERVKEQVEAVFHHIRSPPSFKETQSPNEFNQMKKEAKSVFDHKKSPHHQHETHGTSDDIDESTPADEVKGPNLFERVEDEVEAIHLKNSRSIIGGMEAAEEWSSSSGGVSDSEVCLEDSKDEEEFIYGMGSLTNLQFRKYISKACWKSEMGIAEVLEHKGRLFTSMGIVRNGKIYCSIEETLFLAEIGALLLVDEKDTSIRLKEIYEKVAEGKNGCSWEGFELYQHLKSLGYIVGRHGIPWSLKTINSSSLASSDSSSIVQLLNGLDMREEHPAFEVYLPNSKFQKTSPGDPSFIVYLARGRPPSRHKIEQLERQCNGIPLKVGHLEHGRVSFFSFDKVDLPVLP